MQRALPAGQRGFLVSVNGIMASINSIKDTDTPRLLLLGLLLPSVLVPNVGTVSTSSTTVAPVTSPGSMMSMSTSAQSATITAADTTTTGNQGGSSSQPAATVMMTTSGAMLSSSQTMMASGSTPDSSTVSSTTAAAQPPTTAMSTEATTMQSATAAQGGTTSMTIQTSAASSGATASNPTTSQLVDSTMMPSPTMAPAFASQNPVTGSMSSAMSTPQTTTTSDMSTMTQTNDSYTTDWMPMLYCPSFMCDNSDCYTMYTSQNTTACNSTCQLRRMDMYHTVGCSESCVDSCVNNSQINCSVSCCNYTGCLNDSFAMMMTTTSGSMATTILATTPMPVRTTTTQPVTADKGNKCHKISCKGAECYKNNKNQLETCSQDKPHCELKKELPESKIYWKAGCANCTTHTACKASTTTPCHQECCNATMTSCLMLNGTLNVPSSATRGLCVHTELMASLLGLLAIALLL